MVERFLRRIRHDGVPRVEGLTRIVSPKPNDEPTPEERKFPVVKLEPRASLQEKPIVPHPPAQRTPDDVRADIAREEQQHFQQDPRLPKGMYVVQGGELEYNAWYRVGKDLLPRSWKPSWGIPVDTYTINHPDGMQTIYVDRHTPLLVKLRIRRMRRYEQGVYEEHWSAPEGPSGKRHLLDRRKVGQLSEVGYVRGPDGQLQQALLIQTREYAIEQRRLAQEAIEAQKPKIETGGTKYTPTKREQDLRDSLERSLRLQLSTAKEKIWQQAIYAGANFGSTLAVLYALLNTPPNFLPKGIPGSSIISSELELGLLFGLQSTLFQVLADPKGYWQRLKEQPGQVAKQTGIATALGLGLGILSRFGILGMLGAVVVFQGIQSIPKFINWQRNREARNQVKREHPEVTDKQELRELTMIRRSENDLKSFQEKLKKEQAGWIDQLKALNPGVSEEVIMQYVTVSAAEYQQKTLYLQQKSQEIQQAILLPSTPVIVASLLAGGFGVPRSLISFGGAFLSTILGNNARFKAVNDIREDIRDEYPELFQSTNGNGEKKTK